MEYGRRVVGLDLKNTLISTQLRSPYELVIYQGQIGTPGVNMLEMSLPSPETFQPYFPIHYGCPGPTQLTVI